MIPDPGDTLPEGRLRALLAVEARAARLEGLLAADPGLGALWRAQGALTEACRSVALEDIAVAEGDVIARPFENRALSAEATRGIALAGDLAGVLARPGEGEAALIRAWRAAGGAEDGAHAPDFGALAQAVAGEIAGAEAAFRGALGAAARARAASGGTRPAFERLVFGLADHGSRGGDPGTARWVLRPACALTGDGFRLWSPASVAGIDALLAGLAADLGRGLGLVSRLRTWREAAAGFAAGRHGRSRLGDVVAYLARAPVVTVRDLAGGAGVSERTALSALDEMTAAGIVRPITGRRTARAWAVAPVADLLRTPRPARPRRGPLGPTPPLPPVDQDRIDAALAEVDAGLARLDSVLGKARG